MFGTGPETDEIFMAWNYANYVDKVAAAGKAEYPIPMFANTWLSSPDLKPGKWPSEARLESHRRFIDIHYLLAGKETMGWRAAGDCREIEHEYSAEKDIAFFTDEPSLWLTMHPGTFVVFFPWDAHAPLVANGNIHKVVLKVAL